MQDSCNVHPTCFMRTTSAAHQEAVAHFWNILAAKDLIYRSTYKGWYSVVDEAFYPDHQVEPSVDGSIMVRTVFSRFLCT
eukprot:m.77404 g.77404  ORF g.77404 m.77404 type:complete len:80 (-) comp14063_c0_seq8:1293-1532(-)